MFYSQLVGQPEAKSRLLKMVNDSRVPHALLFSGPEGCGNLLAAVAFTQHLFCTKKTTMGPCDECPSCKKIVKLTHPDLHLVFPIVLSPQARKSEYHITTFREAFLNAPYMSINEWCVEMGAENKQPTIGVDEASDILKKLSFTSYEGSYKVLILWLPERMNADASNKILKVLEEPTENTVFILVSNQPDQLLPTIFSRVQQIPFTINSNFEITEALVREKELSTDAAKHIALLANGNYAEALRLSNDDSGAFVFFSNFQTFMRLAFSFDYLKITSWVDEIAAMGRENHKQFFQYGLEVFRDCLMYNYGSADLLRLNGDEKVFLEKFAPFINQRNYQGLIEEFNANYYFVERNANAKILFMDLMIKCNALLAQGRKN